MDENNGDAPAPDVNETAGAPSEGAAGGENAAPAAATAPAADASTAAPAASEAVVPPTEMLGTKAEPSKIEQTILEWIENHIRNSAVATSTAAWNHLMSSLAHLRDALEGKKE